MISLNLLPAPHNHIIGHRGAPKKAPENTLASFKQAAQSGLNWIEFDVRLTKDDKLVIFHDDTLERTSNGKGLVIEHTLAQLRDLQAGSWFSPEFSHEKIPTLIETIPYLKTWNLTPVIEIKCKENEDPHVVKKLAYAVADCLAQHWTHGPLPMVSSFDHSALLHYRDKLEKPALIGFLVDDICDEHIQLVTHTPNSMIHCNQKDVCAQRVQELATQKIPLFIYTVNNKELGKAYLEAGAMAIFTDKPEIFN